MEANDVRHTVAPRAFIPRLRFYGLRFGVQNLIPEEYLQPEWEFNSHGELAIVASIIQRELMKAGDPAQSTFLSMLRVYDVQKQRAAAWGNSKTLEALCSVYNEIEIRKSSKKVSSLLENYLWSAGEASYKARSLFIEEGFELAELLRLANEADGNVTDEAREAMKHNLSKLSDDLDKIFANSLASEVFH